MQHNLETVYRKMRLNARVLDAEILMVVKDLDQRLLKIEGKNSNGQLEKPASSGSRSSRVSKKKVSTS